MRSAALTMHDDARRPQRSLTLKLLGCRARQLRVRLRAGAALRRVLRRSPASATRRRSPSSASRSRAPTTRARSRVEFVADAAVGGQLGVHARGVASMQVHPGRALRDASSSRATSPATPPSAQAVPSIAPGTAARYFRKTECFCFTPQHFAANEAAATCRCASWSIRRCRARSTASRLSYTFYDESTRVGSLN